MRSVPYASAVDAFVRRWKASGASERANAAPFLSELCDVLEVDRPEPETAVVRENVYTYERRVRMDDGEGSTGRIDLYRRGCFVLEAKQGSDRPAVETNEWTGEKHRLRTGTARRETRDWERAMKRAREQAIRYVRSLPVRRRTSNTSIEIGRTTSGACPWRFGNFTPRGSFYIADLR